MLKKICSCKGGKNFVNVVNRINKQTDTRGKTLHLKRKNDEMSLMYHQKERKEKQKKEDYLSLSLSGQIRLLRSKL